MRYIVAVSGGVDSVVLLDMLLKKSEHELVVAHFDHGIREDSADDARFVRELANMYGLPFESKSELLGAEANEELARQRRYRFLNEISRKYNATIVTAHHKDDMIESIAINLNRGTGWRGLAVLNNTQIDRPLIIYRKQELYDYAVTNQLEWVEDSTNKSDRYLRNRLRRQLAVLPDDVGERIADLRKRQCEIAADIDNESRRLHTNSRYFMTMIDDTSAIELLRSVLGEHSLSLTRPQRTRLLHAIKTLRPGDTFEAGDKINITFTKRDFIVKYL